MREKQRCEIINTLAQSDEKNLKTLFCNLQTSKIFNYQ